ncbi:MAG: ribonuclease H-like domain-containing protein [Nitrospira sp.]|nr:ribonuclease H-like domain-containing protein [Nitrospira sp.]
MATERRWWQEGLLHWRSFIAHPHVPGLSPERKALFAQTLTLAQANLDEGNLQPLAAQIRQSEHWRFYDHCRSGILYLDIETNGFSLHDPRGTVTVIGLHRNGQTLTLVHDETLRVDRLQAELNQCTLLVTFFGTGFDVPYLRAKFPCLRFPMPHFDLYLAALRLGLHGGLKPLERAMGIERAPALASLNGRDAVRLWSQWRQGHQTALDTLVAYNTADTENLVPLADLIYKEMRSRFGPETVETVSSTVTVPNKARSSFSP